MAEDSHFLMFSLGIQANQNKILELSLGIGIFEGGLLMPWSRLRLQHDDDEFSYFAYWLESISSNRNSKLKFTLVKATFFKKGHDT